MGKKEFQSNVVVANEYTLIGNQSKYGIVTIDTVVSEINLGVIGRTTLYIQADENNSDVIFIGLDNTVTSNHFGIALKGGMSTQLKITGDDTVKVFALSNTNNQKVSIIEGVAG